MRAAHDRIDSTPPSPRPASAVSPASASGQGDRVFVWPLPLHDVADGHHARVAVGVNVAVHGNVPAEPLCAETNYRQSSCKNQQNGRNVHTWARRGTRKDECGLASPRSRGQVLPEQCIVQDKHDELLSGLVEQHSTR